MKFYFLFFSLVVCVDVENDEMVKSPIRRFPSKSFSSPSD